MSEKLSSHIYKDEAQCVETLLEALSWDTARSARVNEQARARVEKVRASKRKPVELETFLQEYGLNTEEGLALMTLAEALLRIPDARTADALIRDKMAAADWLAKQGDSKDWVIKAAGMGLALTQKTLDSAISKLGEPVIRKAMVEAMHILGKQFVLGRTIKEALKNAQRYQKKGYRMSYDMLSEGARTAKDAENYYQAYYKAIEYIAKSLDSNDNSKGNDNNKDARAGMSVKLSALHPRYEYSRQKDCVPAIKEKLLKLAQLAARHDLCLTVDAEEVDRLELSLDIIKDVAADTSLKKDWDGFGFAVQAYQKRAPVVIDTLSEIANKTGRKFQVRLVKGAYWDTEIKHAQSEGLPDYAVFTRKANSDLCYLECARKLLARRDVFYPMFATHNAHTMASIIELSGHERGGFEFQRLHGMGQTLHNQILNDNLAKISIYAPCGSHEELLPYLVRRLLENGASTSFVYQILNKTIPVEDIIKDPVLDAREHETKRHPKIALPQDIYEGPRKNAAGLDLHEASIVLPLIEEIKKAMAAKKSYEAFPLIGGKPYKSEANKAATKLDVINPANKNDIIGHVWQADETLIPKSFETAQKGFLKWSKTPADERAKALEKLGDLIEKNRAELMGLCVFEAGKTIPDALSEVREAIDFCRYYAQRGRIDFDESGQIMHGATGEKNTLTMQGRGVFVCISPWNFPLAIFTGQITAALMAGNAVIAKPASNTPLIAMRVIELMIEAGIPADALNFMPCRGSIGGKIVEHSNVAGVCFTGSTAVALGINRALAAKNTALVPLIAETGGQNAMIADSSALPEQIIDDVLVSAFGSAGQRCSALRVLFVQEDIADKVIEMLKGAMKELRVGDPIDLSHDVGPTIDEPARAALENHKKWLEDQAQFIAAVPLDHGLKDKGSFFAPIAYEIKHINELEQEVFGPVLHVIRYKEKNLGQIIEDINATGYGLTLGVHSRISAHMDKISRDSNIGNIYINRAMTGAVVGVQPFGGMGLSGTGPKAGGPHYLHRFAMEKLVSIDTTRQGGNASLVTLEEE